MGLVERSNSHFWKILFQEEPITSKLPEIAACSEGQTFHVPQYGDVLIKALAGSELGDNFMSDTYAVTATSADGVIYNGFFKVN